MLIYNSIAFFSSFLATHFATYSVQVLEGMGGVSIISLLLFILAGLGAITLIVFTFIECFSRYKFGTLCNILAISVAGVIFLSNILMFITVGGSLSDGMKTLNRMGYWWCSISYWLVLASVTLFQVFYYWGAIEPSPKHPNFIKKRIGGSNDFSGQNVYGTGQYAGGQQYPSNQQQTPNGYLNGQNMSQVQTGISCISGLYQGRQMDLPPGVELRIGSNPGLNIVINDPAVEPTHCIIRYNAQSGMYELYDCSKSGVYVGDTGYKAQPGVVTPLNRGSVIQLGTSDQRFRLL